MDKFNKYFNDQYFCDFSKSSMQEEPFTLEQLRTAESTLRNKQQEQELYDLLQFINVWKDKYDLFCHEFNCYTLTKLNIPVWYGLNNEYGFDPTLKSEFYIDEFFNMILDKRAKFELQSHMDRSSYNYLYSNLRQYDYAMKPNVTKIISGDKFIISWQEKNYRLDIKINSALICSLIGAISSNYVMYQWYSKQSNFKKFIEKISNEFKYLSFEISNRKTTRIKLSSGIEDMLVDIDTSCGWCYLIYRNEVVKIENNLGYNHLDKLFGKDRKEPLTREDIQLYSIVNEGRKPIMYDFEF